MKAEKSLSKKILRSSKKYTKPEKGDYAKELERLNDLAENTNRIQLYVIFIVVIMVATMLLMVYQMVIDANNRKSDATNELIRILNEQKITTK